MFLFFFWNFLKYMCIYIFDNIFEIMSDTNRIDTKNKLDSEYCRGKSKH
jgi:hypothetical protein